MTVRIIENLDELTGSDRDVIFFSRYRAGVVDNGGARRIAQLLEIFEDYEFDFVTSLRREPEKTSTVAGQQEKTSLLEPLAGALIRLKHRQFSEQFGRWVFFSRRIAARWVAALKQRKNLRLVVVDDPIFFAPLIHYLHDRKIPVIANCHNIETLSRGQVIAEHQLDLLRDELRLLSLCSACITCSREETFLLRNLGMDALYLPYYPPRPIEGRLLRIRAARERTEKQDYLLLGSVGNEPTRVGMERVIDAWQSMGEERLIVAGYGTEVLRDVSLDGKIRVAGSVDDEELDALLLRVRGGIVFQQDGAGALNRIRELLISGVPVIANSHAARTYHDCPGVLEMTAMEELSRKLADAKSMGHVAPLPPPPDPLWSRRVVEKVFSKTS